MPTNPKSYIRKWNAANKTKRQKYFHAYYLKHRAAKRAYAKNRYQRTKQSKTTAKRSLENLQRTLRYEPRPQSKRRPRNPAKIARKEIAVSGEHDPALPELSRETSIQQPGDDEKDVSRA